MLKIIKIIFMGQTCNMQVPVTKGIVSRDFGTLFFISLDRFEGRYRAGSGLFFILMTFSRLNFKKLVLHGKDPLELMILKSQKTSEIDDSASEKAS
jgi:hypothetical protein